MSSCAPNVQFSKYPVLGFTLRISVLAALLVGCTGPRFQAAEDSKSSDKTSDTVETSALSPGPDASRSDNANDDAGASEGAMEGAEPTATDPITLTPNAEDNGVGAPASEDAGTSDSVTQEPEQSDASASDPSGNSEGDPTTGVDMSGGEPSPDPTVDAGSVADPPEPDPSMQDAGSPNSEPPVPSCAEDEELGPKNHCYFFEPESSDWDSARERCQERGEGWDLAAVTSISEHNWLVTRLTDDTWVGARRFNGVWTWVSSSETFWQGGNRGDVLNDAFTRWESNEPNGDMQSESCMRYSNDSGDWYWADIFCSRDYPSVCEQF